MGCEDWPAAPRWYHPLRAGAHLVNATMSLEALFFGLCLLCMQGITLVTYWHVVCGRILYGYLQPVLDSYLDDENTRKVNQWASSLTFVTLNW